MSTPPAADERPPKLLDFSQERIRVLHFTWIAFFMTFYVWFNMAPLTTTMLDSEEWLTEDMIKVLLICNVALTIPVRIVVGALVDRFGSRIVYSALMCLMAIPTVAFAFGNSFMQLVISRLVLGSIGAGFVIGIKMVAQWFPPKYIGRAEGFYGGWGNFGAAAAAMTLPWITLTVMDEWFGLDDDSWRWALAANAAVLFAYGVLYYFLVKDTPEGKELPKAKKTEPMMCSSYGDLAQYLVWSFPLVGALGLLAWRISDVDVNGKPFLSSTTLWVIYAALALIYVAHVIKTLHLNLPYLRRGVPEGEKYHWGSVAALNSTYFANFGAELAVVSMLPAFFETVFKPLTNDSGSPLVTATVAGVLAASFPFINLVARPLGGLLSDRMGRRKHTMLIYMFGITVGFVLMGFIGKWGPVVDGERSVLPTSATLWWVVISVGFALFASVFVQGGAGATFAIIPMVNKRMTGQIAGMAGAYGSIGGVVYLVVYSLVDAKTFFYILAGGALVSFTITLLMLREPERSFAESLDYEVTPAGHAGAEPSSTAEPAPQDT
ncbi:MAG: Nitrate/nitrite transporter NrtP [Acidimicrobiales bacterium]|nr:MAG: MFS transporter [Actinomycetota bacterium]MBV6510120.1 Nitrate/nitrite transporter NrtP [Acidimicrobiales bacterium]RIK05767.1 MAG: MFS transporter [Acidobacteriota bacterium]